MRSGRFYSPAGPEIRGLDLEEQAVTLRWSPVASVTLVGRSRRGSRANAARLGYPQGAENLECDSGGAIVSVRLEWPCGAPYDRIELAVAAGRKTWTNPL